MPTSAQPPAPTPFATAEPWDLIASAYATEALPFFESFAKEALRLAALPELAGARIADVATGPGTLALMAAAAGANVSAIDISPGMVAELGARAKKAGLAEKVEVKLGDAQWLPFPDAAYDAGFSMFGLMFFPDRVGALRELRRVLRPGARAIISSWVPFEGPFNALFSAAHEILPELPIGDGRLPLSNPDEIRADYAAAGFGDVTVEIVGQQLEAPSFEVFWDKMLRTNAPLALIRQRLGDRWADAMPVLRDKVHAAAGDGPLLVGRGAYLAAGVA